MARYEVYRSLDGDGYLLDIQSDLLDNFDTRLVVPLIPLDRAPVPAKRLNPIFSIGGERCSMVTQWMASVAARHLRETVTSVDGRSIEITDAVDFLLHGY